MPEPYAIDGLRCGLEVLRHIVVPRDDDELLASPGDEEFSVLDVANVDFVDATLAMTVVPTDVTVMVVAGSTGSITPAIGATAFVRLSEPFVLHPQLTMRNFSEIGLRIRFAQFI